MRYNLQLAESFKKTTKGLDEIIKALTYPPPLNPKTVVTYQNGDVIEYLIEGELEGESIPDIENVVRVEIGTAVTSIGDWAFSWCSGLMSLVIPNSATSIGDLTFYNCSGLTSIMIGNGVTNIGRSAFFGCSSLTSIVIPDSVKIIGENAFEQCSGLTSITIGDSVTSIGYATFEMCSSLLFITIPNSVTNIGDLAFNDCSSLTSVIIPDSVTSIGTFVFSKCPALSSITSRRTIAPTVQNSTFGTTNISYTGRNTFSSGNNILKVPIGATGYDSGAWFDPLQDSAKCGFHVEYE